jgi:predicted ATPase
MLTLHVQNLRVLRLVRWPLAGVSVLTGANGAGKTTALLAPRTLRAAFDRGLPEAARTGKPYETRLNPPPADPRVTHADTREAS